MFRLDVELFIVILEFCITLSVCISVRIYLLISISIQQQIYKPILQNLQIISPQTYPQMHHTQQQPAQQQQPQQQQPPDNQSTRQLINQHTINNQQIIDVVDGYRSDSQYVGMEQEQEEMMETANLQNKHDSTSDYNKILNNYQQRLAIQNKNKLQQARLHLEYSRILDNSYIQPSITQKLYIRFLNAMDRVLPVLAPQSNLLLLWNFIIIFVILFQFFQAPVAIFLTASVYEDETNSGLGLTINGFCLFLLYIDTFLTRISIAYYHKGKLISTRLSIFHTYLYPELILNIISILSLTIYITSHNYKLVYIKLLFYCRIYSVYMIDKQILHTLEFMGLRYAVYRLGRLLISLWFVTSLAATVFFAIDYHYYLEQGLYYQNGWLWLTNSQAVGNLDIINNNGWFVWYTYALYWAIQTASTVGYGDITPMNPVQVLYVVLNILFMTILFAFYVNTIWSILEDLQNDSIEFTPIWYQYKKYMRKNGSLTKQLKQRISNCLYQLWQDKINQQIQSEIICKKISKELQDAFYVEYKSVFYVNLNIFTMMSCVTIGIKDVMKEFVDIIENYNVSEGINVYIQGSFNQYLYYLRKGEVGLKVEDSGLGRMVENGESFGVEEFFRRIARNHTAQALAFTKMWRVSYTNLKTVLHRHPYLNQRFNQLSYRIVIERSPLFLNLECWKCKSKFHFLNQCPQINSWRDRISLNKNNILSQILLFSVLGLYDQHQRKNYVRSKVRSVCNKNIVKIVKVRESLEKIECVEHFREYFQQFNISA